MNVSNQEVINHFVEGRVEYEGYGNLRSEWDQNNKVLLSYEAVIAAWTFNGERGEIVIFTEWDEFSPTVRKHVNMIGNAADESRHPVRRVTEDYDEWK